MATAITANDRQCIAEGCDVDSLRAHSVQADACRRLTFERRAIFADSWQWGRHAEKLRDPGADVAGQQIGIVRDKAVTLRAFYNVCKHRAHQRLKGEGRTALIVCPSEHAVHHFHGLVLDAYEGSEA